MPQLTHADKRHVICIDEAHIIAPNAGPAAPSEECANASAQSAEYVERFLAELAGYRYGLWMVEQLHTKVAPGVPKNTRNKMIHGLPDGEERNLAGDSILLGAVEKDAIARQRAGEAFLFSIGAFRAHRVKAVNLFSDYNYPFTPPPNDENLLAVIETEAWFIEAAFTRLIAEMDIFMERMDRLTTERREIQNTVEDAEKRLRKCLTLSAEAMKKTVRAIQSDVQQLQEKFDSLHQRFRTTVYEGFMDQRIPRGLDPDVLAQRERLIARHAFEIAEPAEKLRGRMAEIVLDCKYLLLGRVQHEAQHDIAERDGTAVH